MIEELSLYQAFKNAALANEDETAIYYFKNRISFGKLLNRIDDLASVLQNQYLIKKGDVVLVSLPNIPETIILFYALNMIGAISNMVHPNSPFEVVQKYYKDANCKLAFLFQDRVYKQLKSYINFDGTIVICSPAFSLTIKERETYLFLNRKMIKELKAVRKFMYYHKMKSNNLLSTKVETSPDDCAVLLHSASTTGISKTICLGSRSFNFTASKVPEIMCMDKEDLLGKSLVSVLPSFHGFGLCMTMHAPLVNSFGVVMIPKFSAKNVVNMMKRTKNVICICGVPNVFKALLNEPTFVSSKYLRTLRSCFSGGDSLSPMLKEKFDTILVRKGSDCRLYEGYGLTETLAVCSVNTHKHHKYGSIGYPISGVDFKIFDDKYNECVPFAVGEISIKSESNMIGYYNDEEATKETYHCGYLTTGDLGYMDEDGFLYFKNRKKRVIKVSGVAVFPHEIESVISNLSGVQQVCVVQIPDESSGFAAKAYVVSKNKDPERIKNTCRAKLISWSIPKEVEFVQSLPMTKYHKVDYRKVQEMEDKKRAITQ